MNPMIEFIETLLYTHDCVIIPHFGGFVLNTKDFQLSENDQLIVPKSKWVAFNERLQSDDGLVATEWAIAKGINQKQAFAAVHRFAEELSSKLKAEKTLEFGKIGVFSLSHSGRIQFEPNQEINFDLNQYGLFPVSIGQKKSKPILIPSPVEKSSEDLPIAEPEPIKRVNQGQFYGYVLLAFLIGGIAAFYLTEPNSRFVNSSFSPLTIRIKKEKTIERKITKPAEVQKEANKVEEKADVPLPVSSGIYLVVGSFKTEAKAALCQAELVAKGFEDVKIIEKGAGEVHFRVSVGEVADFNEGYAAAARLKSEKKLDIWVYKR